MVVRKHSIGKRLFHTYRASTSNLEIYDISFIIKHGKVLNLCTCYLVFLSTECRCQPTATSGGSCTASSTSSHNDFSFLFNGYT